MISLLKKLISIPGARRVVSPVFYYFGAFDDIYLFQFHDRVYGETMKAVFATLNDIERSKWSLFDYARLLALLGLDAQALDRAADFQSSYNAFAFADPDHADVGSEGLWANSQNFFLVALPALLAAFLAGRALFGCLFARAASVWLRKFAFWPFLALLLLDGNVQQFAFWLAAEWRLAFAFAPAHKLLKAAWLLFGFALVAAAAGLFFLSYSCYRRKNFHLMDNCRNVLAGHAALALQLGLRNALLGALHSLLRGLAYRAALLVLCAAELLFAFAFAAALFRGVYKDRLKMWLFLLLCLTKLVLIATLAADYRAINLPVV